jgi:hypothetical protein
MGICIYYQGTLRDLSQLPQLVARLQTACARLGWPCYPIDERILGTAEACEIERDRDAEGHEAPVYRSRRVPVDDRVRGVVIQPPGCETLFLTFGSDGRLVHYSDVGAGQQPGHYGLIVDHFSVKTQFSSPAIHMQVCELLRLVEPYMAQWEVADDGGYWGTWDERVLQETWALYEGLLEALSQPEALEATLRKAGVDIEITEPPEVGKILRETPPPWRKEWGISAGDN